MQNREIESLPMIKQLEKKLDAECDSKIWTQAISAVPDSLITTTTLFEDKETLTLIIDSNQTFSNNLRAVNGVDNDKF